MIANLLLLNVTGPDIWPLMTGLFQPQPVLLALFCNTKSWLVLVCEHGFTWSAEQRLGWRTGWTRSFLFHFLYQRPVKWLFVRVFACVSQESAALTAVVSAQDVHSLCTVVTLWIMPWSHISMDTQPNVYANVSCTQSVYFNVNYTDYTNCPDLTRTV